MRRFSLSSPQIPSGSGAVSFQPIVCSVLFGLLQCVIKMIGQPHLENKVNSFQTRGRICCETEATTQLLHNCGFLRLTLLQEYSSTRDTWTGRHERKSLLWTEGTWLYNFNNQFYLKWTYSILDTLRFFFIHGSWELLSGGCLTSQLHTDRHPSKTDWASNTVRYYQHEPCLSLTCSYFWALHIDKCIPWLLTLTLTIGNICLISILALTLIWS